MNRFACPEVYAGSKISDIFIRSLENRASIIKDGTEYIRLYQQYAEQNVITYYGTATSKAYFSSYNRVLTPRTPATLASAIGITVDDTCLASAVASALLYIFDFTKLADLEKSSFWYTVYGDDGLHFCLPHRISTSKQIKYNSVTQLYMQYLDPVFQGEAADDYYIDLVKPGIRRDTIDSTLKAFMLAKEKSKKDTIMIQSSADATHNDYVSYNGKIYIILSMLEDPVEMTRYYIAVKEELTTGYSFSGSNISVIEYYNTSADTQTSLPGKRFGINTVSPQAALDVTKNAADVSAVVFNGGTYNTTFGNSTDQDNIILPGTTKGNTNFGTLGFTPLHMYGFLGPGVDPTALIDIAYVSATVPQLRIRSGTVQSIAMAGEIELSGSNWFVTPNSSVRHYMLHSPLAMATAEGGIGRWFTAGVTFAQGDCAFIAATSGVDNEVYKTPTTAPGLDSPVGFAYNATSSGGQVLIVHAGATWVLPSTAITLLRGYTIYTSTATAGTVAQTSGAGTLTLHWRECGHVIQGSTGAGGKALAIVHWN